MKNYDFIIIGAGIIGLTQAYYLRKRNPTATIAILEKEVAEALHASGRNSGVLHTGIYYGQDTQKAKFCLEGNHLMKNFCREHQLGLNECGKLIVAKTTGELEELQRLYRQGRLNGANISYISAKEALEIEPNARTLENAIWSPETASVSPKEVCNKLRLLLISRKIDFFFGCKVLKVSTINKTIKTDKGEPFTFGYLINCAGVYADNIARQSNLAKNYQILPFKGLYISTKNNDEFSLKTNIYPVPNKMLPFLGVHFTVTASGQTKIGPTALPALWREHYQGFSGFSVKEILTILSWYFSSFFRNDFNFRKLAAVESKYLLKKNLIKEAGDLLRNDIQHIPFIKLQPGVRAQLYDKKNRKLVNDFVFLKEDNACHILNAVSPAFTSSFAMANYITQEVISV